MPALALLKHALQAPWHKPASMAKLAMLAQFSSDPEKKSKKILGVEFESASPWGNVLKGPKSQENQRGNNVQTQGRLFSKVLCLWKLS